jgi:hypothetical protein
MLSCGKTHFFFHGTLQMLALKHICSSVLAGDAAVLASLIPPGTSGPILTVTALKPVVQQIWSQLQLGTRLTAAVLRKPTVAAAARSAAACRDGVTTASSPLQTHEKQLQQLDPPIEQWMLQFWGPCRPPAVSYEKELVSACQLARNTTEDFVASFVD